jgi:WD40 repeat protein
VKLWDVASGKEKFTLSGHTMLLHDMAYSPDGRTLASASADRTVKLWEVATGRAIQTLRQDAEPGERLAFNAFWSVAFSPDGRILASAGADQTVKLWEVATGRAI